MPLTYGHMHNIIHFWKLWFKDASRSNTRKIDIVEAFLALLEAWNDISVKKKKCNGVLMGFLRGGTSFPSPTTKGGPFHSSFDSSSRISYS